MEKVIDPLGIVQENEIWLYNQMMHAQIRIDRRKWDAWNFLGFWDSNRSLNSSQKTRLRDNKNKRTCQIIDFSIMEENRENQRKQKERQVLEPRKRTKKAVGHEGDGDANCNWHTWNSPQRLCKGTGRVGSQRVNQNHPNYSTVKSPGDLRWLAITLTPVKRPSANIDERNQQEVK